MSAALMPCLIVLLGAASAFFSAAEIALFSLEPDGMGRLREGNMRRAATMDALFAQPRRLVSMILLADTLANVPLGLLCLYCLREWPRAAALDISFTLEALALFALIVGVCDLLPKLLALQNPEAVASPAIRVLGILRPVLNPLTGGLQHLGERVADWLTPRPWRSPLKLTEDEFESLVTLGEEGGALHPAESEMIQDIIKLGDKTTGDCMTPRVDTFALPDDLTNSEVVARVRAERHRRALVHGETPDEIVGILDVHRFLLGIARAGGDPESVPPYEDVLDPPSFVSETMRALDLLRAFLAKPQGMAVVVDEYGGNEGVITLGDIVEEIIGDALPRGDEALYIEEMDADHLLVNGNARLEDINEHAGFELSVADGVDTIGGLIFNQCGHVPKSGAVVHIPAGPVLTVRQATRRRIEEVVIERKSMRE